MNQLFSTDSFTSATGSLHEQGPSRVGAAFTGALAPTPSGPYAPCPHKQGGQNQPGLEVWILRKVNPAAQV